MSNFRREERTDYLGRSTIMTLLRTFFLNEVSIIRSGTFEHIGAVVKVPARRRSKFFKQGTFLNRKDCGLWLFRQYLV
jgi:hypothetical protein